MYQEILFTCKKEFRKWLLDNHDSVDGLWLVFSKTDEIKTIKPDDALKEALCFGWIDGQIKRIDDIKYIKKFTPRRKRSIWSERNRKFAKELIQQKMMTKWGYAAIERAKQEGMWNSPRVKPATCEQIQVLTDAIGDNQPAFNNFAKMSPSIRRIYAGFYSDAKKDETKVRRLKKIIERLNQNLKPM